MTKLNSAIITSAVDIDNLSVKDDSIEAYGSSAALSFRSYGNRNDQHKPFRINKLH